jgi:hypothetical protein
MSSDSLTGRTVENLEEEAQTFYEESKYADRGFTFEEVYCLGEIRQQPDDYDGPQRYCFRYSIQKVDNPTEKDHIRPRCKFHGGACVHTEGTEKHLDPYNDSKKNLKHGMYATDDFLKEHFTEKDQELFDFIMSWGETYGIDSETDPAEYDLLQQLAVERVRGARSAEYLLNESETDSKPVFDGQGNLHEREATSNALSEVHQRQRKLILKIMKEMGLTPKEKSKMDKNEAEASATEALTEVASEALSSDKGSYDPEEYEDE